MTLFRPHRHHQTLADVPLETLWQRGIRGLLLDLDNTLAHHHAYEFAPEAHAWIDHAKDMGFVVLLYSNAMLARSRRAAELLGIDTAPRAYKPVNFGLKPALRRMKLPANQVALIGDQLFTDVLAGKFGGLTTILIEPLSTKEWIHTRMFRRLEYMLGRRAVGEMDVLHRDDDV